MFNKKRAQGIPMETVIIAIIVLVVLVVIIAFFVGGTGSVMEKFKSIFTGAKGEDIGIVKNSCQQLCDSATNADLTADQQKNTGFCTRAFKMDLNNDGKVDICENDPKKFRAYYCDGSDVGISCSVTCGKTRTTADCI